MGQSESALETYERALWLARSAGDQRDEAICLRSLGETYRRRGKDEQALDCFLKARAIFHNIGSRTGEADALLASARIRCGLGQFAEARSESESAIEQVESLRTKVAAQEFRLSYFASKQSYYRFQIELLMRLHRMDPTKGFDQAALETAERARARGLLDLLTESRADVRRGADPGLLDSQRTLERRLDAKASALARLPADNGAELQATLIRKQMEAILDELREIEARIRVTSPHYAALTQPQPLHIAGIQEQLDSRTMLLEYSRGEQHTFLWTVTNNSVRSFELSSPENVLIAIQRLRQFSVNPDEHFQQAAADIAKLLVWRASDLLGHKRLLIVCDGALRYVPFAALPSTRRGPPLAADHEIVYLPSASATGIMRSEIAQRRPAPKAIAVFADPVFDAGDERANSSIPAAVDSP